MKYVTGRPFADPAAAARKLVEIANAAEAVQDGRAHSDLINAAFLDAGGTPAEYRAGIEHAISKGWLWRHESGVYEKFTRPGPSCSPEAGWNHGQRFPLLNRLCLGRGGQTDNCRPRRLMQNLGIFPANFCLEKAHAIVLCRAKHLPTRWLSASWGLTERAAKWNPTAESRTTSTSTTRLAGRSAPKWVSGCNKTLVSKPRLCRSTLIA